MRIDLPEFPGLWSGFLPSSLSGLWFVAGFFVMQFILVSFSDGMIFIAFIVRSDQAVCRAGCNDGAILKNPALVKAVQADSAW